MVIELVDKKRNFRYENLGLDINYLDGYRVAYGKVSSRIVAKLLDEDGNVKLAATSSKKDNVFAYATLIQLYVNNNNREKTVDEVIELFKNENLNQVEIAKRLGITKNAVNMYFKIYNINNKIEYGKEKRKETNSTLGLNVCELDGYRVVYQEVKNDKVKIVARLIGDNNEVIAVNKSTLDNKIYAYSGLIQSYVMPKEATLLKVEAIRKLYNSGMNKTDISKTLGLANPSLNSYFNYYNIDNRHKF